MDFKIRLAGRSIAVHSIYPDVYYEYNNFLAENSKPDIEICTDEDQIAAEFIRANQSDRKAFSIPMAEAFLVQRLISEQMLNFNTFLMHGTVIAVDNKAYMFTAPSGTGKTTHVRKWLNNIKGSFIVNGDKPLIIADEDGVYACGTPWNGKEQMGNNAIVPLDSIVFMKRSDENRMEAVHYLTVFPKLLEQTYLPMDEEKMKKRLELLTRLKGNVGFYQFHFNNFKEDTFRVSYNTLIK